MATVEWQLSCTDLKQRGALLLETEEWADCKIVVGPGEVSFRVHRLILAMASPVFESMFFEGVQSQDSFNLPDMNPEVFETLVSYIYTDNISIDSYEKAHKLYKAATKFLIPQLARVCAEYMCCNVGWELACAMYDTGYKYQDQDLMHESLLVIKPHLKEVLHHKSFEEADIETIAAIFGIPDIEVQEIELFQALERYARAHTSRKRSASPPGTDEGIITRQSTRKALQNIRFLTFSLEQFVKGPARSELFTKGEALAVMLNIAGENTPLPPGFTDSKVPRYYQRAMTPPPPAPVRTSLLLSVPSALAARRSVRSARAACAGAFWTLRVLPMVETSTNNVVAKWLGVFVSCHASPDSGSVAYPARVLITLVATSPHHNKTHTFDRTYTNEQNDWGVRSFILLDEALDAARGFTVDGALTFTAHVAISSAPNNGLGDANSP